MEKIQINEDIIDIVLDNVCINCQGELDCGCHVDVDASKRNLSRAGYIEQAQLNRARDTHKLLMEKINSFHRDNRICFGDVEILSTMALDLKIEYERYIKELKEKNNT